MSWRLTKDTLFDSKGNEICFFLPGVDETVLRMIKNGDEIMDIVGEFVKEYDYKKKIRKKLFSEFENLVDKSTNYDLTWTISWDGHLFDNNNENIICSLSDKNSIQSKIIMLLPEVFAASQELLKTFSSSSNVKQKPTYERICKVYDKLSSL